MIRIAHIITTLATGGAEAMLYKLLSAMDRAGFTSEVYCLSGAGAVGEKIAGELGIPVFPLRPAGGRGGLPGVARLAARLCRNRPDLVQTWMYHANLLGGMAGRWLGRPVIWNIRRGSLEQLKPRTRWVAEACSAVSAQVPARIVCCSPDALERHAAAGYARARMTVIPNGFDLERFRPDRALRQAVRGELGVDEEAPLLGLVARFDPAKDHWTFLRAAALVRAERPQTRFLLCGKDVDDANPRLRSWIGELGLRESCRLLGVRQDVPRLLAGLDVMVSSSLCEGFPNVLGEAMACGVPCAATDAGDSGLVVGGTGRIAPRGNAEALAGACLELIDMGRQGRRQLGAAARRRVETHFSLGAVAARYQELYAEVFETCAA